MGSHKGGTGMKKYATYRGTYKNLEYEYFITTRPYYKKVEHKEVIAKISYQGKTIMYLNIPLLDNMKLNNECQERIEKYITDYCEYNFKEILK